MKRHLAGLATAVAIALGLAAGAGPAAAQDGTLTVWSHFADHEGVRSFFREVEALFESENPGVNLEMTFYEKNALFAAMTTALQAGQGPDIIYLEPDRMQFVESGLVRPIEDPEIMGRLEDFAKQAWTYDGKVYGVGMQAFTVELYDNEELLAKVLGAAGIELGDDRQLTQDEFLKVVETAADMGITPVVQGIGDRPYPGSYLTHELLLRELGPDDYAALWAGKLSYKDPRVVEVFDYMKQVIDAGAYPKTFTTLKLGESHYYFHTNPGGLMFPLGSWYSSRAFNPPDKGGQPKDFPLGIMQFPALDSAACPHCKTIGIAGTYAINAASQQPDLALKFFELITRPEMGRKWVEGTKVQTGVKIGDVAFGGEYADYFKELNELGQGRTWFLGTPIDFLRGQCKETFVQVINGAFPAGLIGPDEALDQMEAACHTG
jgi:multiple sugar transport system substrate-binding protein